MELSPKISVEAARLTEFHGDPADRMIAATAIKLGAPLITKDEKLARFAPLTAIR